MSPQASKDSTNSTSTNAAAQQSGSTTLATYNAAVDLLDRNLERANKTAYIDDRGSYTFADLALRVNRCASALTAPAAAVAASSSRRVGENENVGDMTLS